MELKNCIVSKKIAPTNPTQAVFIWFGFYFKNQPNQTTCFLILRFE